MTDEELDRWCFLFASVAARQDVTIALVRAELARVKDPGLGPLTAEQIAEIEGRDSVRRARYQRWLRAFWKEQTPDAAIRSWIDHLEDVGNDQA